MCSYALQLCRHSTTTMQKKILTCTRDEPDITYENSTMEEERVYIGF